MDREINVGVDTYLSRLYKLLPAEITAAYLAISSLTDPVSGGGENDQWLLLAGIALLVLTPLYLWRLQGVTSATQLAVTTVSFPIWAINVSSIQVIQNLNVPSAALGILLVIWTLTIPLFKIN